MLSYLFVLFNTHSMKAINKLYIRACFQLSLSAAVKSYKIPSFKMNTDSISNTTAFTVML